VSDTTSICPHCNRRYPVAYKARAKRERRANALRMFVNGKTYAEVANELYYASPDAVYRLVDRYVRARHPELAARVRALPVQNYRVFCNAKAAEIRDGLRGVLLPKEW
jgi:hypothetical protein